jgi:hypothetical protein
LLAAEWTVQLDLIADAQHSMGLAALAVYLYLSTVAGALGF